MKPGVPQGGYIFLTGAIRAMEARQLTAEMVDLLLRSSSVTEAMDRLKGSLYQDYLKDHPGSEDYEAMLSWRRQALYGFIRGHPCQDELSELLGLPFDYHNLKLCLKDRIFDKENSRLMVPHGFMQAEEIAQTVMDEAYHLLPPAMADAVTGAVEQYFTHKKPALIDLILDRAMYLRGLDIAQALENSVLAGYWQHKIDLYNILVLARGHVYGDSNIPDDVFVPGGMIGRDLFLSASGPSDDLYSLMSGRDELSGVTRALHEYGSEPLVLERECDNALTAYMNSYRFLLWGMEAVYIHVYGVELELRILGMAFSAIKSGLSLDLLRKRLPRVFGGAR